MYYSASFHDAFAFVYRAHDGSAFTTRDRDNDEHGLNCASLFHAGWWFKACYTVLLTGVDGERKTVSETNSWRLGVHWHMLANAYTWNSLKDVNMLVY